MRFWRNDAGMRGLVGDRGAFSGAREENAGGGVAVVVHYGEGVLGGVFSRRIGLASLGVSCSATGG